MWWRFRLRAVSYIEVAISLFICGIIMNIGVNIVKNIQHHRMQVAIERAMHDISIAAAKYAACHGYLPMPIDTDGNEICIVGTTPHEWLCMDRTGFVPWKELGMHSEPMINGQGMRWTISATSVQRAGWRYSASVDSVHMNPKFWTDLRWATFARPRWCGVSEYPWWGIPDSIGSENLEEYMQRKQNFSLKSLAEEPPKFCYLYPALQHAANFDILLLLPKLIDLYELELELSLYPTDAYKSSAQYISFVMTNGMLLQADFFYGLILRTIWTNEYVLKLEYQDRCEYWSRYGLLELIGISPCLEYVHPGYSWEETMEVSDIGDACRKQKRHRLITKAPDHLLCLYFAEWYKAALGIDDFTLADVTNPEGKPVLQAVEDLLEITDAIVNRFQHTYTPRKKFLI